MEIPLSMDWREEGVLNGVRNQEACNCCWCITACTCCEAMYKIAHREQDLPWLSPQDIINCYFIHFGITPVFDKVRCYYGSINRAFRYIMTRGVLYEKDCPFVKKRGECIERNENTKTFKIKGYHTIANGDEVMLLSHVSKHPVGCVIKITDDFLNLEKGTIYMGSNRHIQGSHAMVIVGYGEDNGINYWIMTEDMERSRETRAEMVQER
ncbi:uncharacterized protein A4U43_C05F32170 [Asparagus officinalis]|uniref:Peptidase C1A papain C-terminal domain-containing protein n=1 Tax=Asparagus officinalis TaxID=4686 RepID=A0A5P1EW68_ASPOF|nr:uncharacterized protein A4U43_C05F32170 [Asparagus officinalis]